MGREMRMEPWFRGSLRARLAALRSSAGLALLTIALGCQAALAQDMRVLQQPPSAELVQEVPARTLPAPSLTASVPNFASRGVGSEVSYDLHIRYVEGTLFNPTTGRDDQVRLRSYVGDRVDPANPFVAPTVDLWPGETFRLTLHNELPADDPSCPEPVDDINTPHCFNATNMHSHGLWVSPAGNSDNVLLTINPQVSFQYEYNIPADHPAGTFWYHSHRHGSTALQVSSGMAGALVIHGDRLPARTADGNWMPGDIDTLLKDATGRPIRDRVLLFQQIAYACPDDNGDPDWLCEEGEVGTVESYDQLGPQAWLPSGRFTSINGTVLPTLVDAVAGEPERWRMIHGGVRQTLKLMFRQLKPGVENLSTQPALPAERSAFVSENCTGQPLSMLGLASDGLTRSALDTRTATILQPGYREDLLAVFPEPGTYCVIDETLNAELSVNGQVHERAVLAFVVVSGAAVSASPTDIVKNLLTTSAASAMPPAVRADIVADLADGLKLSAFVKHRPVADSELTGSQSLGFRIAQAAGGGFNFEIGSLSGTPPGPFQLENPASYDPNRIDRTLTLGAVEEWTLTSFAGGHPFHIHVNPFEIVEILDRTGQDVSGPGDAAVQPFANLKGVWKDTIFVPTGFVLRVRTRYERYIGDYVLHCHILDHEDEGMMQNVRIVLPGNEAHGH